MNIYKVTTAMQAGGRRFNSYMIAATDAKQAVAEAEPFFMEGEYWDEVNFVCAVDNLE